MIIGDKRRITVKYKILAREVVQEKTTEGEKSLKISLKAHMPGGQEGSSSGDWYVAQARSVKLVAATGQTSSIHRSYRPGCQPRTFKTKHPEVETWKTN